jgi:hypothetical protein
MNSSFQPIPASSFAHGYKLARRGNALFLSNDMYAPVHGKYTIFYGKLNDIYFTDG